MKKGRFSLEEMDFIAENYQNKSPTDIGVELDRDPESVDLYVKRKFKRGAKQKIARNYGGTTGGDPQIPTLIH